MLHTKGPVLRGQDRVGAFVWGFGLGGNRLPGVDEAAGEVDVEEGFVDVSHGVDRVAALGAFGIDVAFLDAGLLMVLLGLGIGDDSVLVEVCDTGGLHGGAAGEGEDGEGKE